MKIAGAALGGGILSATQASSQSSDSGPTVLTIRGDQGRADYEFSVTGHLLKTTDDGASINGHDQVHGRTASGFVDGGNDSYRFTGEIAAFSLSAPATVYVDGSEVDPDALGWTLPNVLTIRGDQGRADYEFSVSGNVLPSTDDGASINAHDTASLTAASGLVDGGADSYRFSGEITEFTLSAPATVSVNGSEVDPSSLGTEGLPRTIEVTGGSVGNVVKYSFSVDGDIEGTDINSADSVSDSTATGAVNGGTDRYAFSGSVTDFSSDGDVTIVIDGEDVDPSRWDDSGSDTNIGGGEGYPGETYTADDADVVVRSLSELRTALSNASRGDVVYVPRGVRIDTSPMAPTGPTVPSGVTLASNRGVDGSPGGMVYSTVGPSEDEALHLRGNALVTGLRVRGDVHDQHSPSEGSTVGLWLHGDGAEVANCEVYGWRVAAIRSDANTHVHHSHIHHNAASGTGYGVLTPADNTNTLVEYNYFGRNRHCIAANGAADYEFRYNIVGEDQRFQTIDHHDGGVNPKIHHNTVKMVSASYDFGGRTDRTPAVNYGGAPRDVAEIHHNWFYNPNRPSEEDRGLRAEHAINQINVSSFTNMEWWDNHYGTSSTPPSDLGHPR